MKIPQTHEGWIQLMRDHWLAGYRWSEFVDKYMGWLSKPQHTFGVVSTRSLCASEWHHLDVLYNRAAIKTRNALDERNQRRV